MIIYNISCFILRFYSFDTKERRIKRTLRTRKTRITRRSRKRKTRKKKLKERDGETFLDEVKPHLDSDGENVVVEVETGRVTHKRLSLLKLASDEEETAGTMMQIVGEVLSGQERQSLFTQLTLSDDVSCHVSY